MAKTFEWTGTTVAVTGASRGIGAAFARLLAPRVARLILVARSEDDLNRIAGELGCEVTVIPADLTDPSDRERVWKQLEPEVIDVWINNAGIGVSGCFHEIPEERADRMRSLNLDAPLFFMRRLLPRFVSQGHGRILNVGSIAGLQGTPYMAEYGATKAFLNQLSEAVYRELRSEVRGGAVWVGALLPGSTDTPFFTAGEISADQLVKVFQTPEQVAATGIRAIERGKMGVISGWMNRTMAFGQRGLPRRLVSWLAERTLRGLRNDARKS